jgi:hypothetical protein
MQLTVEERLILGIIEESSTKGAGRVPPGRTSHGR